MVNLILSFLIMGMAPASQDKAEPELAKATFAGGCFWCMEPPYDALDGVVSTTSGYVGGHVENQDQVKDDGKGRAN